MTLDEAKKFTEWLSAQILLIVLCLVVAQFLFRHDDTDASWFDHSGLKPLTDARTGCQYLKGSSGGLTPRIDGNGNHMGCRPVENIE